VTILIITKGAHFDTQGNVFASLARGYGGENGTAVLAGASLGQDQFVSNQATQQTARLADIPTIQQNSVLTHDSVEPTVRFGGVLASKDVLKELDNNVLEYTVQEGDNLSFIASDFGVSMQSIIWANKIGNVDRLKPGTKLIIPPVDGVIHRVQSGDTVASIANQYETETVKIIEFNHLDNNASIYIGQDIVVPDGILKARASVPIATSSANRFASLPNLDGFFVAPTTGYNWGIIHGRNAIDIANACGTPIYAAAGGAVVTADSVGWNGGFGKYIKISHSNGTETVYAHASQVLIGQGSNVARGQLIAYMGTTGNSTGCHLHFEVHGAKNPLSR